MEFLVLIVVGIIIWKVFGDSSDVSTSAAGRRSVRTGSATRDQSANGNYFAKLEPATDNDGSIIPGVLMLWVRGQLKAPDSTQALIRVTIFDEEIGPNSLVWTHNKRQQANDHPAFCEVRPIPYGYGNQIVHANWTPSGIPVINDSLIGPRGGTRKLIARVEVLQVDQYIIWRGEVPFVADIDF